MQFGMIFETQFLHEGHLRWNLWFATPNYAGAFLVSLLTYFWFGQGLGRWRVVLFLGEVSLYFLLAKTYSRGALVALGIAGSLFIVALGWANFKKNRWWWAMRLISCGGFVLCTGFFNRLEPIQLTTDRAITNRLDLWRGGVAMLTASPLQGWGAGESGRAYMNWFQTVDRNEDYTTMVNSYLHVAVEHGLPSLAIVLFLLALLLVIAWFAARCGGANQNASTGKLLGMDRRFLVLVAGASLLAWSVANAFTTLWIEPQLWIMPGLAIAILAWQARTLGRRQWVEALSSSGAFSILSVAVIWGVGLYCQRHESIQIKPGAEGMVVAQRAIIQPGSLPVDWHVWPDTTVLGRLPGKELRRWLNDSAAPQRIMIHSVNCVPLLEPETRIDRAMLFGRQCARLGSDHVVTSSQGQLWLVHPSVPPPSDKSSASLVTPSFVLILPEIDEAGLNGVWREWAEHNHAQVIISPKVGLDIRAAWPQVAQSLWHG